MARVPLTNGFRKMYGLQKLMGREKEFNVRRPDGRRIMDIEQWDMHWNKDAERRQRCTEDIKPAEQQNWRYI